MPKLKAVAILPLPLLRATVTVATKLGSVQAKWSFGGDAAEVIQGVNVQADHLEILTTSEGTDEICKTLAEYVTVPPADVAKKLTRDAVVDSTAFPAYMRSRYAELRVDKIRVEVHGGLQYRVWDLEWGDTIDFEPEQANIAGTNVRLVPLKLVSELDMGLGWYDRVALISDVLSRNHRR